MLEDVYLLISDQDSLVNITENMPTDRLHVKGEELQSFKLSPINMQVSIFINGMNSKLR